MSEAEITTDVLIVGAGPAGASAAVFLGKYGISTMMISRYHGTADSPRAHIVNQRAMEALRDAGLEDECMTFASPDEDIEHTFWLRSMSGEELARTYSWGNDPARKGDYAAGSPCRMSDLPQTRLEPILVNEARRLGSDVRFNVELVSFVQDDHGVLATLKDRVAGTTLQIRAQYMLGADGARSRIVEQLGIPLVGKHGLSSAMNIHCDIDLTEAVAHRHGSLYGTFASGIFEWAPVAVFRMVRPWNQWLVALMAPPGVEVPDAPKGEIEEHIRKLVGIPEIAVNIISVSKWTVNDIYAEYYAVGRVFCLGDAVHRHPPTNGLGSNTCIQDAFNLAWKLALVLQGQAAPALLETYNAERQPVGRQIVARANKSMAQNQKIWMLLGESLRDGSSRDGRRATDEEIAARKSFRYELDLMKYEYHAHGVEMNRSYESSAVISDDTPLIYGRDVELFYQPSTRPGAPLPHVWLGKRASGPRISTLDIAGKQRFVLFTGESGEAWREAAASVSRRIGVTIDAVAIGPFLDYEDIYGEWVKVAAIENDGCILVRPDLHVAWRSARQGANPEESLQKIMTQILGA